MDNKEPVQPPESRRPADQKMLRDIAAATDRLSSTGAISSADWFKSKEYPLAPSLGLGGEFSKVF